MTDYASGTLVNVGVIAGGSAKNTAAGQAHCVIDARASTRDEAEKVTRALEAIAAQPLEGVPEPLRQRLGQARVRLSGQFRRPAMESTPDSEALLRAYAVHARAAGLGGEPAPLQGGGSDANLLASMGVPAIDGLGPFGRHFHSAREYSSLSSLKKRTQALACFLAKRG